MTKEEYDQLLRDYLDKRLISVVYYDLDIINESRWDSHPIHDYPDFGLDLVFEDDSVLGITWGSEFGEHGISLRQSSLGDILKSARITDVSKVSRWESLIGATLGESKIYWYKIPQDPYNRGFDRSPQELELNFNTLDYETRPVFVHCAKYLQDGRYKERADHLCIFFDRNSAREFGMC
jgi:hypothetical protein